MRFLFFLFGVGVGVGDSYNFLLNHLLFNHLLLNHLLLHNLILLLMLITLHNIINLFHHNLLNLIHIAHINLLHISNISNLIIISAYIKTPIAILVQNLINKLQNFKRFLQKMLKRKALQLPVMSQA